MPASVQHCDAGVFRLMHWRGMDRDVRVRDEVAHTGLHPVADFARVEHCHVVRNLTGVIEDPAATSARSATPLLHEHRAHKRFRLWLHIEQQPLERRVERAQVWEARTGLVSGSIIFFRVHHARHSRLLLHGSLAWLI